MLFYVLKLIFYPQKEKKNVKEEHFSSFMTARKQLLQILVTLLWSQISEDSDNNLQLKNMLSEDDTCNTS